MLSYLARPLRKKIDPQPRIDSLGRMRAGPRYVNADRPRLLFVAVDKARYKPVLQRPYDQAINDAIKRIPDLMASQLAENIAFNARRAAAAG